MVFLSAITIVGIIFLLVFKLNLGIDFTSGTRIEVTSDTNKPISTEQLQKEMDKFDFEVKDITLAGTNNEIGVVRVVGALDKEDIAEVKDHFKKDLGAEPNVSTVSPTIGKELAKNAI